MGTFSGCRDRDSISGKHKGKSHGNWANPIGEAFGPTENASSASNSNADATSTKDSTTAVSTNATIT